MHKSSVNKVGEGGLYGLSRNVHMLPIFHVEPVVRILELEVII